MLKISLYIIETSMNIYTFLNITTVIIREITQPKSPFTSSTKNIRFFPTVSSQSTGLVSIDEIVKLITTDTEIKKHTEYVCNKFAYGLQVDWLENGKKIDKNEYQKYKAYNLKSVTVSGIDSKNKSKEFTHTGLINVDIDDDTKEQLDQFRSVADSIPSLLLLHGSVSNKITGGLSGMFQVDMNVKILSEDLKDILGISDDSTYIEIIKKLHSAYHSYITALIKRDYNINIAGASKDMSRQRYLSHDPNPYYNPNAKLITQDELLKFLKNQPRLKTRRKQRVAVAKILKVNSEIHNTFTPFRNPVFTTPQIRKAERIAIEEIGYLYSINGDGRWSFLQRLVMAANRLGVKQELIEDFIIERYGERHSGLDNLLKTYEDTTYFNCQKLTVDDYYEEYILKQGQYLSDIITPEYVLGKMVIAGCGTGKTSLVKLLTKQHKIIIISPTLITAENHVTSNIQLYNAEVNESKIKLDFNKSFTTVYQSLETLVNKLGSTVDEFILIFDECQNVTTGTHLADCMYYILDSINFFKDVVYLTGTNIFYTNETMQNVERIIVKKENPIIREGVILKTNNVVCTVANQIKEAFKNNEIPFIYLNDTSEEGMRYKILRHCKKLGIKVKIVDATKKGEKLYKDLVETKLIQTDVTDESKRFAVISTAVIKEGNDIMNTEPFRFIIVGVEHPNDIEQLVNRPRIAEYIKQYYIRKISEEEIKNLKNNKVNELIQPEVLETTFSVDKKIYSIVKQAEEVCEKYNLEKQSIPDNIFQIYMRSEETLTRFTNMFVKYDGKVVTPDLVKIGHQCYYDQKYYLYGNQQAFINHMEKYNINVTIEKCATVIDNLKATVDKEMKEEIKEIKNKKLTKYQEELGYYIINGEMVKTAKSFSKDKKLSKSEELVISHILKLSTVIKDEEIIKEILEKALVDGNNTPTKMNLIVNRLCIAACKKNKALADKNTIKLISFIEKSFKIGEYAITLDDMLNVCNNLRTVHTSFSKHTFKTAKLKAKNYLKMFFKMDSKRLDKQIDGIRQTHHLYKFTPVTFDKKIIDALDGEAKVISFNQIDINSPYHIQKEKQLKIAA